MRPPNNSTAAATAVDAGFRNWNTPIPYLFAGLALMLGLITVALAILACSYRNSSLNSETPSQDKPANTPENEVVDSEPKIVVIMAGDDNPTYLAKPISSTLHEV